MRVRFGLHRVAAGSLAVSALVAGAVAASAASLERGGGVATGRHGDAITLTRFRLGAPPVAVAVARGSVWVVEETKGMQAGLVRLDPLSGRRQAVFTIGRTGPDLGAATAAGGVVWAAAGDHVIRVDADRPAKVVRALLPGEAAAVAAGGGSVWVATVGERNTVSRLDSSSLAVEARIPVNVQPVALEAEPGSVWLASTGGLWKVDAAHDRLLPAPAPVAMPVGLAATANRLWLIEQDGFVIGLDRTGRVRTRVRLPFSPGAVALTGRGIWVTDNCGCRIGKLALIDLRTHRLLVDRPVGATPVGVTAGPDGGVWVATFADETLTRARL